MPVIAELTLSLSLCLYVSLSHLSLAVLCGVWQGAVSSIFSTQRSTIARGMSSAVQAAHAYDGTYPS